MNHISKEFINDIYTKYMIKVENIYREVIQSQKNLHPEFSTHLVKFDFPSDIPEAKKEEITQKLIKKMKKIEKGENFTFINNIKMKEITPNNLGDIKDKELKERLKVITSDSFDPLDLYLNNCKRGFNEIFSMFERFNNEIFEALSKINQQNLKKPKNGRSIHNIIFIRNFFLESAKINLEDFPFWFDLVCYFYTRNILVHKDGIIDKEYINNLREYANIIVPENKLSNKVRVDLKQFKKLADLMLSYFKFVKDKLIAFLI